MQMQQGCDPYGVEEDRGISGPRGLRPRAIGLHPSGMLRSGYAPHTSKRGTPANEENNKVILCSFFTLNNILHPSCSSTTLLSLGTN